MTPQDFDQLARAWATRISRRNVLLSFLAAVWTSNAAVWQRQRKVSGQTEVVVVATPETRPVFDPLYPPLEPISVGSNEFVIDGQTIAIDPDIIGTLVETQTIPIEIQGDTFFVSIDSASISIGTPIAGTPVAEATPEIFPTEGPCLGKDNSQDVEIYDRGGNLGVTIAFVRANEPAVGNLRWKNDLIKRFMNPGTVNNRRWCSGTLISDDLWLTAGHCFNQFPGGGQQVPTVDGTDNPISREEIALNMQVDFHYQVDERFSQRPLETIDVIELVEDRLGGLDYSIVRLASPPSHDFMIATVAGDDTPQGNLIAIIGHPRGEPKRVAAGTASEYVNDRIYYNDLDTDYGSSGSAILSNPDGWIVGVHTTGGCDDGRSGENSGFRISSLLRKSPTLRSLL